jgi:hypothetical protein
MFFIIYLSFGDCSPAEGLQQSVSVYIASSVPKPFAIHLAGNCGKGARQIRKLRHALIASCNEDAGETASLGSISESNVAAEGLLDLARLTLKWHEEKPVSKRRIGAGIQAGNEGSKQWFFHRSDATTRKVCMLGTILLILLILMLIGALPAWPHSRGWGYYPSGGLGLVLIILIILLLLGKI